MVPRTGLVPSSPPSSTVTKILKRPAKPVAGSNVNAASAACGEHGGDPASVMFCHKIGLDYVSCSPFRVPIARLAAAQAALM